MTEVCSTYFCHILFLSSIISKGAGFYADTEQIQQLKDSSAYSNDIVIGASVCPKNGSAFLQRGLVSALYSAMWAKIDQLIISDRSLLGGERQQEHMAELFQSYGVSIKSASNCGSNNS